MTAPWTCYRCYKTGWSLSAAYQAYVATLEHAADCPKAQAA